MRIHFELSRLAGASLLAAGIARVMDLDHDESYVLIHYGVQALFMCRAQRTHRAAMRARPIEAKLDMSKVERASFPAGCHCPF